MPRALVELSLVLPHMSLVRKQPSLGVPQLSLVVQQPRSLALQQASLAQPHLLGLTPRARVLLGLVLRRACPLGLLSFVLQRVCPLALRALLERVPRALPGHHRHHRGLR